MQNKKLIIILTVIISALCLYSLSFTLISRGVQKDAEDAATNSKGEVNLRKKQAYLDSVYQEPVSNFLGMEYTYKEVKEKELGLGLDLQGGMNVVLEVSPVEILKALAGNKAKTPEFENALKLAYQKQKDSQKSFTELFYEAYAEANNGKELKEVFSNTVTREKGIKGNESDAEIKKVINEEVEQAISRAETILRTRIDKFGVVSPNIQRLQGTGRIQLELPGVDNPQRVRNLLSGVAQLEFMPVYDYQEFGPFVEKINDYLLTVEKPGTVSKKADTTAAKNDNLFSKDTTAATKSDSAKTDSANASAKAAKADSVKEPKRSSFISLSKGGLSYSLKDTAKINKILAMERVRSIIPSNMKFLWEKPKKATKAGEEILIQLIPVNSQKGKTLAGDVVLNARVETEQKKGGEVQVAMTMNDVGSKKWKIMTKEASEERSRFGVPRRIAIVLDNLIYSAPAVQNEIPNGQSVITGNFDIEEANDLSTVLEAGKLPAPVKIVEEVIVGPTLGQEAIEGGLKSMVAGMLVVIMFMILYYSRGGVVADIALLFNLLFIVGIMANFNAVLTLPGIAGILLSVAIAVDANVLINERIKEDLNEGKSIDTAINSGYSNASSAILDSNVTTLIKGFVLLTFGSGLILGFAVTLIIGIFCSLFTSVLITRVIFNMRKKQNVSFSFAWSRNLFKTTNFDFIGKRKIFYTISSLIIVAGIVSIVMKGFNLGVDFKGGRTYIVQFANPVNSEDIKKNLHDSFGSTPEVKTYGSNNKYKITTTYLVEDESTTATEQAEKKLTEGISKIAGAKAEVLSSSKVGPTIADDIRSSAVWSLVVAIVLMFLYILIRFKKWQFALGTMISLTHVVLVVIAVFTLLDGIAPFSLEVDQAFVAAILTVIGYSINDSVVVFDRIREFLSIHKDKNTPTVINNALNDTLSRTIITGMSTIFVIIILFVFGGETIKGFSFAMLIGVLVGTYSSLCIGSPVLVDFANWGNKKEKEKEVVKTSVKA